MAKKESKTRGVLSAAADFVSTFVTAVIVIVAVAIVALRLMGWSMYSVDSYSMTPAYPVDCLVVVRPVEPETIQVGDVITYVFNEDGVLVTHRVTEIDRGDQTFTTKGDANDTEDPAPVLWGNVVGKVVIGIPKVGALLRVLTSEENRPMVIGVIVGLLVLAFGWDIVSGRRKKRKAREAEVVHSETEAVQSECEAVRSEPDADRSESDAGEITLPDEAGAPAASGDDADIEYIDINDISRGSGTEDKSSGTGSGDENDKE